MHILVPVYFNSQMGGLHLNVLSTVQYLKRKNHFVTVLCKPGTFSKMLKEADVNVIETDFEVTDYKQLLKNILELHNNKPIDIIHTHPFKARRIALIISKLIRKPLFITIHGRYTDDLEHYIDRVAMVFTVSEGIKNYVIEKAKIKDKHKIFVVRNGVDLNVFKPKQQRKLAYLPKSMSALSKKLNISIVSRFDKDKQYIISLFYKALKFTTENYNNVYWTIVGDGTEINTMREETKKITRETNSVSFVGWKNKNDLAIEYQNSDIIIAPGRSALEGLSCGKPVIAIGSKGYVGLITEDNWLKGMYSNFGGIGTRFKEYQEGAIENDLKKVLDDHAVRERLGNLGIKIISNFYNEDTINERLLSFYNIEYIEQHHNEEKISIDINNLIECQVRNITIETISHNKFMFIIDTYEDKSLEYAWYIYGNGNVNKIMYSNKNQLIYEFNNPGTYKIQVYIRRKREKFAFYLKSIQVK